MIVVFLLYCERVTNLHITALHKDWIRNVKTMDFSHLFSLKMTLTPLDGIMQSFFGFCCFWSRTVDWFCICEADIFIGLFQSSLLIAIRNKTRQWNNKTRETPWGRKHQNKNANQACKPCQARRFTLASGNFELTE